MLNRVYRTVRPGIIQVKYTDVGREQNEVLLRPLFLSICKADCRYYFGGRDDRVLRKKLPMALIHECCAEVVYDPSGRLAAGQLAVPVPTIGGDRNGIYANYLPENSFCSSGADGYLQDYISVPASNVIPVPDCISPECASFTESVSTGAHAVKRLMAVKEGEIGSIGVWGDGVVGYGAAMMAKLMLPHTRLTVFGTSEEKLSAFSFADEVFNISCESVPPQVDCAIECVGGGGSQAAIKQIIDSIAPQGVCALMGVTENDVPFTTRTVLEKGLTFIGSSRSRVSDFETVLSLVSGSEANVRCFENLLGRIITVRTVADIHDAFAADRAAHWGKTVMRWDI